MRLAVKKLQVEDAAKLQTLVVENLDGIEPGLAALDARLLLGHSTIDVVAMDAAGTLVLIAVGFTANEEMILKAVEAYSWSLEYPQALQRLYPGCVLSEERPPRLLFVVERMPDAFQRKIKQLGFPEVDCVEVRHLDVDGVATVYFELLSRIRRLAPPPVVERVPQASVLGAEPTRGPAGENVIAMNGNGSARPMAPRLTKPSQPEATLNVTRASERSATSRDIGSVVSMINRQTAAVAPSPELPRPVVEPVVLRQPEPVAPAPVAAEPTMVEPIAVKPVVVEPIAPEPVAAKPLVVELSVAEPVALKPLAVELSVSEPVAVEPSVAEPVVLKPLAVELNAPEPVAVKPVVVEPSVPEPIKPLATSEPVVSTPVTPIVVEPVVAKPVVNEDKPVIAPVAARPLATTTRTIAPPASAPAPLPPLAKPVATSIPSLGARVERVTPRSLSDVAPRPSLEPVAKPVVEPVGERVSFKGLAQALLGGKSPEVRADAPAEIVTPPSLTLVAPVAEPIVNAPLAAEPIAAEPVVAAPAAPTLTVESLAAMAAPASPAEQAMVADTAKQIMSALPQEFEGLTFPNDGVLTRQWMDFLNQMSTTK
jgi:hypothetical protein